MNYLIESKLVHYNINADYSIPNLSIDNQANQLITKTMNDFCMKYGPLFKTDKIFIFYNEDTLISLIEYCILCNIRSITEFKFKLYNKPKHLKNRFNKTDKFVSNSFLKKNRDKIIIIRSNNPIYHIVDDIIYSDREYIGYENISLFETEPTPNELFCLQIFYGATYQDPIIKPSNYTINSINNWFKEPFSYVVPPAYKRFSLNKPSVSLCWIKEDGNDKDNSKVLQEIEKADTIALYFYYGEEPFILQDKTYNFLIKRRTNIPYEAYGNLNNVELARLFIDNNFEINWIGDWTDIDRKVIGGS